MLIFHYAREGTLRVEGLKTIAATCDVTEEGVSGAKSFFEAKAQQVGSSVYYCQSAPASGRPSHSPHLTPSLLPLPHSSLFPLPHSLSLLPLPLPHSSSLPPSLPHSLISLLTVHFLFHSPLHVLHAYLHSPFLSSCHPGCSRCQV